MNPNHPTLGPQYRLLLQRKLARVAYYACDLSIAEIACALTVPDEFVGGSLLALGAVAQPVDVPVAPVEPQAPKARKPRSKPLTSAQQQAILGSRAVGYSVLQIAQQYGVSLSCVYHILARSP